MKKTMKKLMSSFAAGAMMLSAMPAMMTAQAAPLRCAINSQNFAPEDGIANLVGDVVYVNINDLQAAGEDGLVVRYWFTMVNNPGFNRFGFAIHYSDNENIVPLTDEDGFLSKKFGITILSLSPMCVYNSYDRLISLVGNDLSNSEEDGKFMGIDFRISQNAQLGDRIDITADFGEYGGMFKSEGSMEDTPINMMGGYISIVDQDILSVSYDANGGEGTMAAAQIEGGGTLVLPECTMTAPAGCEFGGWQIGENVYEAGQEITVNESMTVTALWKASRPAMTFEANGGSGDAAAIEEIAELFTNAEIGDTLVLPECTMAAPVEDKQRFAGWIINGVYYQSGDEFTLTEEATVAPAWIYIGALTEKTEGKEADITANDAQVALIASINDLAGKGTGLTTMQKIAGDIDGNGKFTAEDGQYILMYATQSMANMNPTWEEIVK